MKEGIKLIYLIQCMNDTVIIISIGMELIDEFFGVRFVSDTS